MKVSRMPVYSVLPLPNITNQAQTTTHSAHQLEAQSQTYHCSTPGAHFEHHNAHSDVPTLMRIHNDNCDTSPMLRCRGPRIQKRCMQQPICTTANIFTVYFV